MDIILTPASSKFLQPLFTRDILSQSNQARTQHTHTKRILLRNESSILFERTCQSSHQTIQNKNKQQQHSSPKTKMQAVRYRIIQSRCLTTVIPIWQLMFILHVKYFFVVLAIQFDDEHQCLKHVKLVALHGHQCPFRFLQPVSNI